MSAAKASITSEDSHDKLMKINEALQLAVSTLVAGGDYYVTSQVEYSSRAINAYKQYLADEIFPLVIGCNVIVKLFVEIFYLVRRKLPTFPGLTAWPANIEIYGGTAVDVLVCYVSLLRINLSYIYLAIFPFIAISFISVLCMRHNRLRGRDEVMSESSIRGPDNGKKATLVLENFNIVALLAPHFILCVLGMLGDPDHDGNNYDISQFFLFLTCMLLQLTIMMVRLPAGISRGLAPASELLCKASLVMLLLTGHMVAADTYGKEVVLLLLPEVVPLLLWFSLHLDRRTPVINTKTIMGSGLIVLGATLVAICGYIVGVPKDESSLLRLYWARKSCAASGTITYIIVLVLRLWPEKVGMATLSYDDTVKLLKVWGSVLLVMAVCLFVFDQVYRPVFPP
uniref:Predicted protein n=1 Tax=Hordeum vulgare subsp. vulgare TaxID=112509 RepID=F2DSQ6_HORVV|nr:predicted protein [Hordeum vulgare subsp. vulgare]